jgi:hypothetical protein
LRLGPGDRDAGPTPKIDERITNMRRLLIPLTLALFAVSLVAVQAASARERHHRVVRGVCTKQSTSKLQLSREDRGVEVEFEVDQNRNRVPWKVTLRSNGVRVASFTATTRAPSGSFEVRRLIADRPGTDRIRARAVRSGETCTASHAAPSAASHASTSDDGSGHDAGDDQGHGHDG